MNSIDTALLDYSRLLLGCEGEIQTSLFLLASGGKLHFFVYFSKGVWSNGNQLIEAFAVKHAITWFTVYMYLTCRYPMVGHAHQGTS